MFSGVSSATYTTKTGQYTKIGRLVMASFQLRLNAATANGSLYAIQGFPFNFANSLAADYAGGGMMTFNSVAMGGNQTVQMYTVKNTNRVSLYINGDEAGSDANGTDISNANFFGVVTYVTDN